MLNTYPIDSNKYKEIKEESESLEQTMKEDNARLDAEISEVIEKPILQKETL